RVWLKRHESGQFDSPAVLWPNCHESDLRASPGTSTRPAARRRVELGGASRSCITDVTGTCAKAGPSDADLYVAGAAFRLPMVLVICFGSNPRLVPASVVLR